MNKKAKIWSIVLGLIIIFGIVLSLGPAELFQGRIFRSSKVLPAYDENKCYDSDGGKYYEEAGTIYDKLSRSEFGSKIDVCITRTRLKEYYCDREFIQSEEYVCESGCINGACKFSLRSAFLKDDIQAKLILDGENYDMNELAYFTNQTNLNKDVFAYKIFSALKMLGYSTTAGNNEVGNKTQIIILNQFQKNYNLPLSEKLDATTLSKLDEELYKREEIDNVYKSKFPLYSKITGLHKNDISKEHVAMLHYLPFEVLPAQYQLNKEQLISCFSGECGAMFKDDKFSYIYIEGSINALQQDSVLIISLLHEYAHYLDNAISQKNEDIKSGLIDTTGFYNISFKDVDKVNQLPFGQKNCFDRKSSDNYDFITDYALSLGVNHPEGCEEKYSVSEDFAESFAAYVASGKQFRLAGEKNAVINQKYQWLKTNVFDGAEYDTDLVWGNASGCNDLPTVSLQTPGYMNCNEEYIWDGTLSKL